MSCNYSNLTLIPPVCNDSNILCYAMSIYYCWYFTVYSVWLGTIPLEFSYLVVTSYMEVSTAHFVLLGINYTLKINWWPVDASHFDESYASPSHNGKISWFFTQRR